MKKQNLISKATSNNWKRLGKNAKLNKRANKLGSKKIFVPTEYIKNKNNKPIINNIINFIKDNKIELEKALFLICSNISKNTKNKYLLQELQNWANEIKFHNFSTTEKTLLNYNLPENEDIAGIVYQSLNLEGNKSKNGSYYTPHNILNNLAFDYKDKRTILDPSCGTGSFLLEFAKNNIKPENLYGIDKDQIAVKIARINIMAYFKNKSFSPNIYLKDFLNDKLDPISNVKFDLIATNPPWGAFFNNKEKKKLKNKYKNISSGESFSYFINQASKMIKTNGNISFILPSSILNIKTHKDIRKYIIDNFNIEKIFEYGKVFKGVFSDVIRLDINKTSKRNNEFKLYKKNNIEKVNQNKFLNNHNFNFNTSTTIKDDIILDKIYKTPHITLKNRAKWALGIVTGNNKKHLLKTYQKNSSPIYKGKDIKKFSLEKPSSYIIFEKNKYQQCADISLYKAKEKLIYKFISKDLVFCYDNKQSLTLNSANILIPEISKVDIKAILGLFNSKIYNYIFKKKFNSLKILKGNLQNLPIPILHKEELNKISKISQEIITKYDPKKEDDINNIIKDIFSLSKDEMEYIEKEI